MSLEVLIAVLVGLAVGFAGGWYAKGKWGAEAAKIEADLKPKS